MNLKRRFRFIFISILIIPLGAMLAAFMAVWISWNNRYEYVEDLEAPRYLHDTLSTILHDDYKDSEVAERGVVFMLNHEGRVIYAHPELLKAYPGLFDRTWSETGDELYRLMMENMPAIPFSISVFRYKGKAGVVVFIPDLISPKVSVINLGVHMVWIFYLGFILLPTMIMNYFIRPMARSMISLERATQEIGRGNWDVPLPMEGIKNNPFNHLIRSFEQMRVELKENHDRQSRIMMSISHDLKTPLTSIKGYVEALQDGMAEDPEELALYTSIIMEKTDLLEERISDLIHFTRLNTTEWKGRFTQVNLSGLLRESASVFRNDALIRKRTMDVSFEIPDSIEIEGDRRMLYQVLENLFDNACRYTDPGDSISYTAKLLDKKILIAMEDSGPGIDEDHIPHIFDNFYRADSGRNTRGIGVGLASAKTIIQSHGGTIYYAKTKLGGAGFLIELPRRDGQES